MARIRKVEIENFRSIQKLSWCPNPGINCLIGPGDSGKSSVLDAIDLCLGARRTIQISDSDFHQLNIETPVRISVTLGELEDGLKNLETYGLYVRGFDAQSGEIEDEPEKDAETVITVMLMISSDLEPIWSLVSERAEAQGLTRNLNWADRVRLAPTRIGAMADYHLGWRRGSVLNRVSEEPADASTALAKAAREARATFADEAQDQFSQTLEIVSATATELGIPVGRNIKAMLDAHSVSFGGGTVSLHDENGVPLKGLGTGSTRLLVAGLQRKAAEQSTVILIDELEHGLEPHRIIRLLGSLGAKEKEPPLQVFMTTHSPVVLQELSGTQLFVIRPAVDKHDLLTVGAQPEIQGTIRSFPHAFLATSIIVCEGASEVGFVRGLDLYLISKGKTGIAARGVALVNSDGGDPNRVFKRAKAFQAMGYRTAVMRDDDQKPTPTVEKAFLASGGEVVAWQDGCALEDELFLSLTRDGVRKLIDRAVELHGEDQINDHIKSASQNAKDLKAIRAELEKSELAVGTRQVLGTASKSKQKAWFKTVTWMEEVAREIVGPDLSKSEAAFKARVNQAFKWMHNAKE